MNRWMLLSLEDENDVKRTDASRKKPAQFRSAISPWFAHQRQPLKLRHALINVWRPITPAIEYPLAVVDWRSTSAEDCVEVDLLYPIEIRSENEGELEMAPEKATLLSMEGYEVKGETYGVAPNESHKFFYVKNMQPEWTMFIKCHDSKGPGLPNGVDNVASCCPHTAFVDPETPLDAPLRRSIEVRCLVFFK